MRVRFNLFIIMMIGFIDQMGIGLVYPLFAVLLFDPHSILVPAGTSEATRGLLFGLLIGLTPLSQFFSSPVMGALSDKQGRKRILLIGLAIGIAGYTLAVIGIYTGNIALLFVYRILVGISDGTASVAHAALADVSTEANKSRHFSLLNMAFGAGFTLGPFFGGKLSDPSFFSWCNYATPFIFAGGMIFLNFMLVLLKFPESKISTEEKDYSVLDGIYNLKRAFYWKDMRLLFLGSFFFMFGWSFFMEFCPILLRERFHYTVSDIGEFYAYAGFWYSLSAGILTAPLLNRFSPEQIISKSLFLLGLYLPLFLLIQDRNYMWFYMPLFFFIGAIIYPTTSAIVSNQADSKKQGEVMGVFHSVTSFAVGISPLFAGSIVAEYPSITVLGGGIFVFIGGIVFWLEKFWKQKAIVKEVAS